MDISIIKNIINKSLFFLGVLMFSSCYQSNCDIYKQMPKGTKLTLEILKKSNSVFKIDNFLVLIYPLKDSTNVEIYSPHLVFFNSKKELEMSSYFLSESVLRVQKDTIISYINEYRELRSNDFRDDIPKGVYLKYLQYQNFIGGGGGETKTNLVDIKYNDIDKTVNFRLSGSNDENKKNLKIPLYKITFDYETEEIMINNVINGNEKKILYFSISKEKLNFFLKQILQTF